MKKFSTLVALLAMFMAPAVAQEAQEYEPDPSQGYLLNRMCDNWFISIDGGASVFFSPEDANLGFTKRIAPNASLNGGKWWTPVFGTRVGIDYMSANSAAVQPGAWGFQADGLIDGHTNLYQQKHHGIRPHLDGMVDLVNLFGGYNPNRIYSLVIYGGFGYGYGWEEGKPFKEGHFSTEIRGGLINSFHVSDAIDINIELKASKYDSGLAKESGTGLTNFMASANVGISYKFPQSKWSAPIVPIIPEPLITEDELNNLYDQIEDKNKALAEKEQTIADLTAENQDFYNQIEDLKNKAAEPTVTVYFEINSSTVRSCYNSTIKAMAEAIKANPNQKYIINGYADYDTGNDKFNNELRVKRANAVKDKLVKCGVNPAQLEVQPGNVEEAENTKGETLNTFNYVLDRAATIKAAK